jgi:two-component system phosphate regulon sensor histidine kinase PhoR
MLVTADAGDRALWALGGVAVGAAVCWWMLRRARGGVSDAGAAGSAVARAEQPGSGGAGESPAASTEIPAAFARAGIEACQDAVVVCDGSGLIVLCNAAGMRLLRVGPERSPVGERFDAVCTHDATNRLVQQGVAAEEHQQLTISGRSHAAVARPIALGKDGARGVVLWARDVSEQAAAVQRDADLVANAGHELRTPLAAIRAAGETLGQGAWSDGAMRERMLDVIDRNCLRLEESIADLMELSRLKTRARSAKREACDPAGIARDVAANMQSAYARRGLVCVVETEVEAARVRSDPRLLATILRNLLDNAGKFAHEGTGVRVKISERPRGTLEIRVIDRGVGIPLADQARVFDRFYQVDASRDEGAGRGGAGLGLAIVREACEAMGGSVRVESVWQQGTTMIVTLPGGVEDAEGASA